MLGAIDGKGQLPGMLLGLPQLGLVVCQQSCLQ